MRFKVMRPWLPTQRRVLRARGYVVLPLRRGRLLIYRPRGLR